MPRYWPFNKYPGTDYETFNWDWLIGLGKKMEKALHDLFSDTGALHQMVDKVLGEHPEWTTTVMDGAISTAKLMDGAVTNNKLADGVGDCWVDDIVVDLFRTDQTDRYAAIIPKVTSDGGDVIKPIIGAQHTPITPAVYARQLGSTFTGNVGCALMDTSGNLHRGFFINDGVEIEPGDVAGVSLYANDCGYIGIKEDRTWATYNIQAASSTLISDGVKYGFAYWYRLVENYAALDLSNVRTEIDSDNLIEKHPRSAIGFRADDSIVFYTCGGRTFDQLGMTAAEVAAEMVRLGCKAAYMMDGGGNASFSFKCAKLNPNIDDNGITDRMSRGSINFVRPDCNNFMADAFSFTGQIRQLTMKQIRRFENYWHGYFTDNLNPMNTTEDPLDISINQAFAVKAFVYTGTDHPEYQYHMFLSLKSFSNRIVIQYDTLGNMSYNSYTNGNWIGWSGNLPTVIGRGRVSGQTVPAGGTVTVPVTFDKPVSANSEFSVAVTPYQGSGWLTASTAAITNTGFNIILRNHHDVPLEYVGADWIAIKSKI